MGNLRLLLWDLPHQYGSSHLQAAIKGQDRITQLAKNRLYIEPEYQKLTFKERIVQFIIGISEWIPLVGTIVMLIHERLDKRFIDTYKLITSEKPIASHQNSWYLNLALLQSAYKAASPEQKKQIRFLAANFLNKITPKQLNTWAKNLKNVDPEYLTKHQASPIEEYSYHRECLDQGLFFGRKFNEQLAYGNDSLFILTDTVEVDHLFPLEFTVLNDKTPSFEETIKNALQDHFSKNPKKPLDQKVKLPFLVDVTNILGNTIKTDHNKFVRSFEEFKKNFDSEVEKATEKLLAENPNLAASRSDIIKFFNENITCISRVEIDGASGIKMLPLGASGTKEAQAKSPLINFVIHEGLYIGAINLMKTVDVFKQRPDVRYAVTTAEQPAPSALYFPHKEDFVESLWFQRMLSVYGSMPPSPDKSYGIAYDQLLENRALVANKPHIAVLGKATVDLLHGLFSEIDQTQWTRIHEDPIISQVFQTALFLTKEHLASAELHAISGRFNEFAKEIELAHAQLSTLLELTRPFKEEDFSEIYKKELLGRSVPLEMKDQLKVGLGKTAVNIFAGICAIVKEQQTAVRGVFSEGSYFEQTILTEQWFDHYITEPSLPKSNIYLAQFNSNVTVGSNPVEYKRRDIAGDIRKLLAGDRVSDPFTVAVDITIDDFYSKNVQDLLSEFKDEINSGKINFAVFSSGQKFYNMGMDNYYGAYFYFVNNGDEKWKPFDALLTRPAHRTDTLSTQWFCLATKYASDSLSKYRELIYSNSRYILDRIPEFLQPSEVPNQKLRVNPVRQDMTPCFIDLKILQPADKQAEEGNRILEKFYEMMAKAGILTYSRGSFGFYHHNFSMFGPLDDHARTIRLNPGINPEENDKIIEFFKSLENS